MDVCEANRRAWNKEAVNRNYWTLMVSEERINAAKKGKPGIWVTPFKNVPLSWIENLKGKAVLLACAGGGQQTPVLAAFGCKVTTIDISDEQIEQDKKALERYGLEANLVRGNVLEMPFEDKSFDAVIMPQAMNFIEDIWLLFNQVHRVLKEDGCFIFGTANPVIYTFDEKVQEHRLRMKYTIPFSHTRSFSQKDLEKRLQDNDTLEYSHTLESIIGGLTKAGFVIDGYYSDECGSSLTDSFVCDSHMAFKAISSSSYIAPCSCT